MATPGIASVDEQGAPLAAGAVVPPGADVHEALELELAESAPFGDRAAGGRGSAGSAATGGTGGSGGNAASAGQGRRAESAGDGGLASGSRSGTASDRPPLMRIEPGQFEAPPSPRPDGYAVRLVTRRSLYDNGTLVQASPSLAGLVPAQRLRLAPKALEQLGVVDGDDDPDRSDPGELVLPVVADGRVPVGFAVLPFNAVAVDEPSATVLLDSSALAVEARLETVR